MIAVWFDIRMAAVPQNAIFVADAPIDPEFEHPAGAAFVRLLEAELRRRDRHCEPF